MNNQFEKSFPKMPINFHNRVAESLEMLPDKKGNNMSIFSKKRYFLVAAAIIVILATTAVAVSSGMFSIISSNSIDPEYTTFSSLSSVQKNIGIAPKIVEKFSNGYTFSRADIVDSSHLGTDNTISAKYKELSVEYKKGSANIIVSTFDEKYAIGDMPATAKTNVDDIEISIMKNAIKFVPTDYVMTDADKADEASGKYSFSRGDITNEEISEYLFTSWTDNGIRYLIMAENSDLTNDDLFDMAKEIIAVK